MLPLNEDRWYYVMFWWDAQTKESYCRVASPAKGAPGSLGYKSAIDPITDKGQKWEGYDIIPTNEKLKVGGGLANVSDTTPFFNLGYGASDKSEKFLLDELTVSNKVCSRSAMELIFDGQYKAYTNQFLRNNEGSLFISGASGV